ncbi:hypothetical protein AUJ14_05590 [Candidatus Micrarchaeota archaeon CG1_02_55_22]|nr:MAG: hypothetical protein AUJ14_05590 [Candidatus Micrarchaeota archaeon CG1_02_55_22]
MNKIIVHQKMRRGNGMLPMLGLVVIGLLVVMFMAGSAASTRPPAVQPVAQVALPAASGVQEVYVKALNTGRYDNEELRVTAGQPVRLHFSAEDYAGCGKVLIMRDFGVTLISRNGEDQVAEFTPSPGRYEYACSMRMFRGMLYAE